MCPHVNDRSTDFTDFKRNSQQHPDELMGAWHFLEQRPPRFRFRGIRAFLNNTEEEYRQYREEEEDRRRLEELASKMVNHFGIFSSKPLLT